ncbi:MAG: TRAP transporter substrate-binding protein DctP [Holophagales bacterium]|jgi:TRAP-type C4-dicarboxylate transport system substrate-binding protein|nr:MAG: TRAP transporter substrate-binding protein DctP [Holophagales bacterium]
MRLRTFFLPLVVACTLAALSPAAASAQKVTIKIATLVPQGSAWHTTLQEMAQRWQELSGGRVTVRLYAGGVAGDDGDVVRKMRLGTLDGGLLSPAGLAEIDRSSNALLIPLAYASYEELEAVSAGLTPTIAQAFSGKGFVLLSWADAGWVRFFTKSAVRTPTDLKGQKLYAWNGDPATIELWKAAGFNPVPLPATEISTALQTGMITAVPTSPQAAVLLQWYEKAPFMTDLPWAVLVGGMVLSDAAWKKIPEELHGPFVESARETGRKLSQQTRESAAGFVEAMTKRGLTVVAVDAAARADWQHAAEAAYPKLREGFLPSALLDQALALRDAERARSKGKGK